MQSGDAATVVVLCVGLHQRHLVSVCRQGERGKWKKPPNECSYSGKAFGDVIV